MKKYYWMKQPLDFFSNIKILKLRKIAGGDTYTLILNKLMLLSVKTSGVLQYQGIEPSFAEELALMIYEDVENVKVTLSYMQATGLIEQINEREYLLPSVLPLIGKETDAAERMRKSREKKSIQSKRNNVTPMFAPVTQRREEIDIFLSENISILEKISFQDFLSFLPKISKDIPKIIEVANELGAPTFDENYRTQYAAHFKPIKAIDTKGEAFALDEVQIEEVLGWLFRNRVKYFQLLAQKLPP